MGRVSDDGKIQLSVRAVVHWFLSGYLDIDPWDGVCN